MVGPPQPQQPVPAAEEIRDRLLAVVERLLSRNESYTELSVERLPPAPAHQPAAWLRWTAEQGLHGLVKPARRSSSG